MSDNHTSNTGRQPNSSYKIQQNIDNVRQPHQQHTNRPYNSCKIQENMYRTTTAPTTLDTNHTVPAKQNIGNVWQLHQQPRTLTIQFLQNTTNKANFRQPHQQPRTPTIQFLQNTTQHR